MRPQCDHEVILARVGLANAAQGHACNDSHAAFGALDAGPPKRVPNLKESRSYDWPGPVADRWVVSLTWNAFPVCDCAIHGVSGTILYENVKDWGSFRQAIEWNGRCQHAAAYGLGRTKRL